MPGEELIQMEAQEAVDKLRIVTKVLTKFKEIYYEIKNKTTSEISDNPWRFDDIALFHRFDEFLDRCQEMLEFQETSLQVLILNLNQFNHFLIVWKAGPCRNRWYQRTDLDCKCQEYI